MYMWRRRPGGVCVEEEARGCGGGGKGVCVEEGESGCLREEWSL